MLIAILILIIISWAVKVICGVCGYEIAQKTAGRMTLIFIYAFFIAAIGKMLGYF